jgi:Na+-driven multidrug efflux pump
MIIIQAFAMPLWSYTNACYFTLRSGGKTGITFLFDFGFTWFLMIPLAYILSHFTSLDIRIIFAIVTYSEIIKVAIGYFMVRSNVWINNIVNDI